MPLSVGVLIIGSLYWEPDRQAWRNDRLCMDAVLDVRAPIRYGRISEKRGNTYTMVFSRGCAPGQAMVVPCRNGIRMPEDLVIEADHLWAAERKQSRNGRISAAWGCVTLLANPHREIPKHIFTGWSNRVHSARPYGDICQALGEGELINQDGLLQVPWPTLVVNNNPVALDLLLATATQPSLTGNPPGYPTPQSIAERWRNDGADNVRYFRNNVECGIRTFEDDAIRAHL